MILYDEMTLPNRTEPVLVSTTQADFHSIWGLTDNYWQGQEATPHSRPDEPL